MVSKAELKSIKTRAVPFRSSNAILILFAAKSRSRSRQGGSPYWQTDRDRTWIVSRYAESFSAISPFRSPSIVEAGYTHWLIIAEHISIKSVLL